MSSILDGKTSSENYSRLEGKPPGVFEKKNMNIYYITNIFMLTPDLINISTSQLLN